MESYGLEMDDLFDVRDVSQDLNEFETVEEEQHDSVHEDGANTTQNEEEGDISRQVAEKLKELGKGAAKKRILRPQPKMDVARLTGERGIPILPKVFENIKYKGKGHEASDLNKMMGAMEHWAHRLFPRMPFDELIERTERLGQKKAVQVCVSKIRLDMPILDNDFVRQDSDDEEAPAAGTDPAPPEEDLDRLRSQEELGSQVLDEDEEALDEILQQERADNSQNVLLTASTPYPKPKLSGLTAEQMDRIRQNQEKARQRRLNKSLVSLSQFNDLSGVTMSLPVVEGDESVANRVFSSHTPLRDCEQMETDPGVSTEHAINNAGVVGDVGGDTEIPRFIDNDSNDIAIPADMNIPGTDLNVAVADDGVQSKPTGSFSVSVGTDQPTESVNTNTDHPTNTDIEQSTESVDANIDNDQPNESVRMNTISMYTDIGQSTESVNTNTDHPTNTDIEQSTESVDVNIDNDQQNESVRMNTTSMYTDIDQPTESVNTNTDHPTNTDIEQSNESTSVCLDTDQPTESVNVCPTSQ